MPRAFWLGYNSQVTIAVVARLSSPPYSIENGAPIGKPKLAYGNITPPNRCLLVLEKVIIPNPL